MFNLGTRTRADLLSLLRKTLKMLVVGLTGGIGSGKSTVAALFAARGFSRIDMDQIAKAQVVPGQNAYHAVVKAFGQTILQPDGLLDRAALRDLVFASPEQRRLLEAILHPGITREVQSQLKTLKAQNVQGCVIEIPLLHAKKDYAFLDRILVVRADKPLRTERVTLRSGLTKSQIEAIMTAQLDEVSRDALGDDLIDNNGSLAELELQVERLYRRYLRLAPS